jgi:histidinol phosphatase-like enzyme
MEILALVAALLLDAAVGVRASKKTDKVHEAMLALLKKQDERLDELHTRVTVLEKAA